VRPLAQRASAARHGAGAAQNERRTGLSMARVYHSLGELAALLETLPAKAATASQRKCVGHRTQTQFVDVEELRVIPGCVLMLRRWWQRCRPGEHQAKCEPRPCWVARVDGFEVVVVPLTSKVTCSRPVVLAEGTANLYRKSALVARPVQLDVSQVGAFIGVLPRYELAALLEAAWPRIQRLLDTCAIEEGEDWLGTAELIRCAA
jgi:hypothetical protein